MTEFMICYKRDNGRQIAHVRRFKTRKLAQNLIDSWGWGDVMHVVALPYPAKGTHE